MNIKAKCAYRHKWIRHGNLTNCKALHRGVERFDGQNRARDREIVRARDQWGSSKVRAGTDALKDRRQSDKALTDESLVLSERTRID